MPLGDHLRADEHVALAPREPLENGEVAAPPRRRIEIHPGDPDAGEQIHELHLDPLRADAPVHELVLSAARARVGNGRVMSAVVAHEPLPAAVEGEGDRAVRAVLDPAAAAALDEIRVPPAVEEDDRLLAPLEAPLERGEQLRRQDLPPPPHVDDLDARHLETSGTRAEREVTHLARAGRLVRFERGRGGPEKEHRSLAIGPEARRPHRVVARLVFLLERGVLLLVDDDDAETGDRREHRRAGADDHADLAARRRAPDDRALGAGDPRMEHRDGVPEPPAEPRDGLRNEGDLGDEHDRAPAAGERLLDDAQIDLRFSAPRDAVEQEPPPGPRREGAAKRGERRLLIGGENGTLRLRGKGALASVRRGQSPGAANARREHGSKRLPERVHVVLRHPAGEVEERRGDERLVVHERGDLPELHRGGRPRSPRDDVPGDAAAPEGHPHARTGADALAQGRRDPVGEQPVHRIGNGDVGERP